MMSKIRILFRTDVILVLTVCEGYQQMTKVAANKKSKYERLEICV